MTKVVARTTSVDGDSSVSSGVVFFLVVLVGQRHCSFDGALAMALPTGSAVLLQWSCHCVARGTCLLIATREELACFWWQSFWIRWQSVLLASRSVLAFFLVPASWTVWRICRCRIVIDSVETVVFIPTGVEASTT